MKVYLDSLSPKHVMFVTPGREFPNSQWCHADGTPRMLSVEFKFGVAEVDRGLARYMIDKGFAKRSPIILPQGAAA